MLVQPIDVKAVRAAIGSAAGDLPPKSYNQVFGIDLQPGVVTFVTDTCEVVYPLPSTLRERYLAASKPDTLQASINTIVRYCLTMPSQLQFTIDDPQRRPKEEVIRVAETALREKLQVPDARFHEVYELAHPHDPQIRRYACVTHQRPAVAPARNPPSAGCPITVCTTIDKLEALLKALGRI